MYKLCVMYYSVVLWREREREKKRGKVLLFVGYIFYLKLYFFVIIWLDFFN